MAGYAYERSGAPRSYKTAAIKAVTAAGPHLEQIRAHFAAFHPSPTNASNNPALDPRLVDLNVPGLVALVEQGALAEAYRRVIRLQGIGAKIAAFFVRDLVTLTSAEGAVDGHCAHVIGDPQRLAVLLAARDVAVLERELSYLEGFVD